MVCAAEQPAGSSAWWDPGTRKLTCLACRAAQLEARRAPLQRDVAGASAGREHQEAHRTPLHRGVAGASVGREHQRRRHNREIRTLQAHPRIGRLLLALRGAPSHERAFRIGELGELQVAASLERGVARPAVVLHDRAMPRGRGNIDHLVVAHAGVFVIDAKGYRGRVQVRRPLLGSPKLMVAGRDRTKLIDGLDRQVAAVRSALGRAPATASFSETLVQGVMCFTVAGLPLLGTLRMRGHLLLHREPLVRRLNAAGPLRADEIEMLVRVLVAALPPA